MLLGGLLYNRVMIKFLDKFRRKQDETRKVFGSMEYARERYAETVNSYEGLFTELAIGIAVIAAFISFTAIGPTAALNESLSESKQMTEMATEVGAVPPIFAGSMSYRSKTLYTGLMFTASAMLLIFLYLYTALNTKHKMPILVNEELRVDKKGKEILAGQYSLKAVKNHHKVLFIRLGIVLAILLTIAAYNLHLNSQNQLLGEVKEHSVSIHNAVLKKQAQLQKEGMEIETEIQKLKESILK